MRFTALHELNHLAMHRKIKECGKLHDRQSDAFASAMLLPAATYSRAAHRRFDPHQLLDDRRIWGASVASMITRAYNLKIYSDWSYRDAFIQMQKMGWKSHEPRPMRLEESTIHSFFFDEAGDRGLYAFDLAEEAHQPYDNFLEAFPTAYRFEKTANRMPQSLLSG
jgi:Zn-dependent peptidase ImmA (M78 family)